MNLSLKNALKLTGDWSKDEKWVYVQTSFAGPFEAPFSGTVGCLKSDLDTKHLHVTNIQEDNDGFCYILAYGESLKPQLAQRIHPLDINSLLYKLVGNDRFLVIDKTKEDILVDSLEEDRRISFHVVPPTQRWLSSKMVWCEHAEVMVYQPIFEGLLLQVLKHLDPNMLVTLNKIYFVWDNHDLQQVLSDAPADAELPGCISYEDDDLYEDLHHCGALWSMFDSIIIHLGFLYQSLPLADLWDCCRRDSEFYKQTAITLAHECRHLGLSNPLRDKTLYPDSLNEEGAVETYARAICNQVFYVDS